MVVYIFLYQWLRPGDYVEDIYQTTEEEVRTCCWVLIWESMEATWVGRSP